MKCLPSVADYMDPRPHQLSPEQDIFYAVDFLLKNHVTGAAVVDADGKLLGVLTERECLRVVARGAEGDPARGTVGEFMDATIPVVPPTMDIYYAAGLFLNEENRHRRRFAVVKEGRLLGVITRYDILRAAELVRRVGGRSILSNA